MVEQVRSLDPDNRNACIAANIVLKTDTDIALEFYGRGTTPDSVDALSSRLAELLKVPKNTREQIEGRSRK